MTTNTFEQECRKALESIRNELMRRYKKEFEDVADDEEAAPFTDYVTDVLDYSLTTHSDLTYKSVKLVLAFGGPNIYLDTSDGMLQLYWGSNQNNLYLADYVCEAIDAIYEELFNCVARNTYASWTARY